ncbi:IclR family transcriptional regulator [Micromonospora saelicesensis]|uniref:Transcriptional regulator, IclR family n=1 Tax=Micromonospora saelicesensis TaxID=285676 RepID=A0A1C4WML1_9ACTN|nr:IclR family transcriptional regulator [Micromonospora saelicesensis]RAO46005.1 putative HTH-type transcriptional regulat or RhmR [Micromonospora saelicesensis]SCE97408.1 transcriptional regulator, IclR family [Micromonospora saelicesensis]
MAQSIRRAIDLIRRSAEHPLSLTEAADVLGVHKSTALRILQTLESARFVRRTGAGTYVLGSGLIELSELALGSMDLRQPAAAHLRALQRATGHTVHLAQLTGDEIIYIDKVDSPAFDAVKLPSRVGRAVSIYASAVGKTILAYLPRQERDRLLSHVVFEKFTDTTFTDHDALEAELARIHDCGWAVDNGEHDAYVMCVAAPIRDSRGQVIAAASITAIEVIASLDQLKSNLPLLLETANKISYELGYAPPALASPDGESRSAT